MGIYKRGETWFYTLTYRGRRERQSVGPSREQAEAVLAKRRLELRDEAFFDKVALKVITFDAFVPEYLAFAKSNKRSWDRDETTIHILLPYFKNQELARITPAQIIKFVQERRTSINPRTGKVSAPATANRDMAVLSTMFTFAKTMGYVRENPVLSVPKQKLPTPKINFLSVEETKALLKASSDILRPVVLTAIHTGARLREILGMRWQDLDIPNCIWQIPFTKNSKARVSHLTATLRDALISIPRVIGSDHVFHSTSGKPLKDVRTIYHNALKRARIERHVRFHDLRHTAASHAVMAGVDLMSVQNMLGHSSLAMVQRYAHLSDAHRRDSARKLEAELAGKNVHQKVAPGMVG